MCVFLFFEDLVGCRRDHSDSVAPSENEELTQWIIRSVSSSPSSRASGFDVVEKPSHGLWIVRSPEFLERVKSPRRLGYHIFKSALLTPEQGRLVHRLG